VTGANGFVGSAVSRRFKALGWRVIQLVRSVETVRGESRRFCLGEDVPLDTLANVDLLVHAAYDFSLCSWDDIRRVNVRGSEKLFDAAKRSGVKRQIFISSLAAYEGCRSKYGLGKLTAEEAAHARGGIILRPGVIYGEKNGGLVGKIFTAARKLPIVPMIGSGRYPLYSCHVEDLCNLIVLLAQSDRPPLAPIVAANSEPITLRGLVESAQRDRKFHAILPVPWIVLFGTLWTIEKLGLRVGFRSDSIISLVYGNPSVDFSIIRKLSVHFRPFLPA
jgi:nucleoside-diphosphate-sugar epimerase